MRSYSSRVRSMRTGSGWKGALRRAMRTWSSTFLRMGSSQPSSSPSCGSTSVAQLVQKAGVTKASKEGRLSTRMVPR